MPKIRPEFQYHELNQAGVDACTTIREGFTDLLNLVESVIPEGRDRSLVITKLQEGCTAAVRGAAVMPKHQR
jgi:hypothetical protein